MEDTILNFYNDLLALSEAGKEDEARLLVQQRFAQLPADLQAELVTRLYINAMQEETETMETIAEVQKKGLDAVAALEIVKKKLESGKGLT